MGICMLIGNGYYSRGFLMGPIDTYKIFQMSILMITGVGFITTCFIVMMNAMMEEK